MSDCEQAVSSDLPGAMDVEGLWYGVTDRARTLHLVTGLVAVGSRSHCGQRVVREASPLDRARPCRLCMPEGA